MTERATTFTFVRHGETAYNVAGQFRGRADPPLTEKGEAEAIAVAGALAPTMSTALYASPRRRATGTAERIAQQVALPVRVDPRLDDFDYGAWTGLTPEIARSRFPALFDEWIACPEGVRFPEGEAVAAIVARLGELVSEFRERHRGERVIVVTHDALIRLCLCRTLLAPLASMHRLRIDLTSISTFEWTPRGFLVVGVNDTRHLGALLAERGPTGALVP